MVGSCLPVASEQQAEAKTDPVTITGSSSPVVPVAEVPLEIAINQFPSGYQGRWAKTASDCTINPEQSENVISLQGSLLKFHESAGTMTAGKRMTSKTIEAEFDFVGEGKKWTESIGFEMSKNREKLTRTDGDNGMTYHYVRCPKLMAG
jgi:hypothetical protein